MITGNPHEVNKINFYEICYGWILIQYCGNLKQSKYACIYMYLNEGVFIWLINYDIH